MSYQSKFTPGPASSVPGPNSIRSTWAIPFHEGGPDVLFVVDSDHKFSLKEMVELTHAARKLEDQQREAVKGGGLS